MNTNASKRMRLVRGRGLVLVFLATTPTAALAWSGCSSSSSSGSPITQVDPGGTYGAEVTVTVVGRGRVTSSIAGIDCPGTCSTRYIFKSASDNGAAAGVTLKAITSTPSATFAGWTFQPGALGTRGRGPEACNPIKREAQTGAGSSAPELPLSFGETNGTPPAGQEGACAGQTTVPIVYNLVATFNETAVVDASTDEMLYDAPTTGASGREIALLGNRLYWRWDIPGGNSGISTGLTSGTGTPTNILGAASPISVFAWDQYNVAYQISAGNVYFIPGGGTTITPATGFVSSTTPCVALTTDTSAVYCRTAGPGGSIYAWSQFSNVAPTQLYASIPSGTDLQVDTSYLYISDDQSGSAAAGTMSYFSRTPPAGDAGAPTMTTYQTGRTYPGRSRISSSRMFWIDGPPTLGSFGTAYAATKSTLTVPTTMVAATQGLRFVVSDPYNTSEAWVGVVPSAATGASSILRASAIGSAQTVFRSGLTNLGGIATDATYIYWTAGDGRVYRARKN